MELTAELAARKKQYECYLHTLLTAGHQLGKSEFKTYNLGDLAVNISSGKNKDRFEDGDYPVFGSTGIIARTNAPAYKHCQILVARVGVNAGFVHLASGRYDVSDNTLIIDVKPEYNLKYLFYLLTNMNLNQYAKGGGQPLITAGQLKKLSVKIPPYEVQVSIVNLLDKFGTICDDLNGVLSAEIESRKMQYKYYRDKLLAFREWSS